MHPDFQRNQRHRALSGTQAARAGGHRRDLVMTYGCPVQALVAAFGLDERIIARWQRDSGHQCRRVHEHSCKREGCS